MVTENIVVTPYYGSPRETRLLDGPQTIFLNQLGPETGGVLEDDGSFLTAHAGDGAGDEGGATFDGNPVTYIGSGTVRPGVDGGLIVIALGEEKDVAVFEAGGQIYIYYPDGPPDLADAVALIARITDAPYEPFIPMGFGRGTMILTPGGYQPVARLRAGDRVRDAEGRTHEVLWASSRRIAIPALAAFETWRPVCVKRNTFGQGAPFRDTLLSRRHRVAITGRAAETALGVRRCFAPAQNLACRRSVEIETEARSMEYFQVMCAEHVTLVANGMLAESLYLNPETTPDTLLDDAQQEALELFPDLRMTMNAPLADAREARMIAEMI